MNDCFCLSHGCFYVVKEDGINDIILPITGGAIKKITLSPENESLSNSHKILQDGVRKHMEKIVYIRSHPSFDNA